MKDIVQQITLLQYDKFRRITTDELYSQRWSSKDKETITPNIVEMMKLTNQLSYNVQNIILLLPELRYRLFAVEFFISIAEQLKELHNFDGFKAIVAALYAIPVFRLKNTMEYISDSYKQKLKEFNDLLSYDHNFKRLREITAACKPPCIPFVGSTLTDLVFTKENEKADKDISTDLINFWRVRTYGSMIKEIVMQQQTTFPFHYSKKLMELIISLPCEQNENRLYELSNIIEEKRVGELTKEDKKRFAKEREAADSLWKKYHSFWKKNEK